MAASQVTSSRVLKGVSKGLFVGLKVEFTGSLIVVPDISIATAPGERITAKFGECRLSVPMHLMYALKQLAQRKPVAHIIGRSLSRSISC